jgi:hypothetical protein
MTDLRAQRGRTHPGSTPQQLAWLGAGLVVMTLPSVDAAGTGYRNAHRHAYRGVLIKREVRDTLHLWPQP